MPRREYYDQRGFHGGWSDNKCRNRLRKMLKRYSRLRYKTTLYMHLEPDYIKGQWFVVRNSDEKPLIHNGRKS